MNKESTEKVENALKNVIDPEFGVSIVEMEMVEDVTIENNKATITIRPTSPFCPAIIPIAANAKKAVENLQEFDKVEIKITGHMMAEKIHEMLNK